MAIDLIHKSHNAPAPYPTMHHSQQKYANFCSEWGIVGYGIGALSDFEFGLLHRWSFELIKTHIPRRRDEISWDDAITVYIYMYNVDAFNKNIDYLTYFGL